MSSAKPHFVYAKLWEPIQPLDRGERYEDPLIDALAQRDLGEVTGGGSQLTKENEIEFAGIDLDLANLGEALQLTRRVLEEAGAPRGSMFEFERDGKDVKVPFGVTEGVAVYLNGVDLPAAVYARTDINVLADQLTEAIAPDGVGEIRGSWMGPRETSIYLYGPNAEALFARIEPILRAYPLCQDARVVIRHGNPDLNPRTVRLPLAA